jgi:hypothetical protein
MTLPEVCPLDENQKCKGRECHLFCLEWRTREPTCLIGYSTTSKVKSWKSDRRQDTYAEDTYHKLSKQPASKKKNISEKGDWIPSRLTEKPQGKDLQRKEKGSISDPISQKPKIRPPVPRHENDHNGRLRERYSEIDIEKASIRLESRLKKESVEEKSIIYGKTQPKVQEKLKIPEKIVLSNKHTTIFTSSNISEMKDSNPSERKENPEKIPDNRKRRKLDEIMEIDTPEVYDEEFWK